MCPSSGVAATVAPHLLKATQQRLEELLSDEEDRGRALDDTLESVVRESQEKVAAYSKVGCWFGS